MSMSNLVAKCVTILNIVVYSTFHVQIKVKVFFFFINQVNYAIFCLVAAVNGKINNIGVIDLKEILELCNRIC